MEHTSADDVEIISTNMMENNRRVESYKEEISY
jgi:hypothetical protein